MPEHFILAFDFGLKHIGVAIGQSLTKTARPLITLPAKDGIPQWETIKTLMKTWKPESFVVGIPLHNDDPTQPITRAATRFANRLKERFRLPVYTVDERLSTWEAKRRLGIKKDVKNDKTAIAELNAMAACVLLEQWLKG